MILYGVGISYELVTSLRLGIRRPRQNGACREGTRSTDPEGLIGDGSSGRAAVAADGSSGAILRVGARSSVGLEHLVYTEGVRGSSPCAPTIPHLFGGRDRGILHMLGFPSVAVRG